MCLPHLILVYKLRYYHDAAYRVLSTIGSAKVGSANCGQSYKASAIVIYDSIVVPDLKIPHIMTLDL